MKIQSEITKKDYSKLMTVHLLKTAYMISIFIVGLVLVIWYALQSELDYFYLFLGLGFIGLPLLIFLTIGQAYDRNKHFNEKVQFIVGDNDLELIGQTFRSTFSWGAIKVKEIDRFFAIYQGRVLLALINKEKNSKDVINELRQFLIHKRKLHQ